MKYNPELNGTKLSIPLKDQKLAIVAIIIIVGLAGSSFYHYLLGVHYHLGFPFNTFLFKPQDRFNDFFNNYRQITLTGSGIFTIGHELINYIYYFISLIPFHTDVTAYLFYAEIFLEYLFFYNYLNIKNYEYARSTGFEIIIYSIIFTFFTYPVLFSIDRGNREMYIFMIMSLSIFFYYNKKYFVSAILLGLAVHAKIYFAIFLLIYFSDRKYKEIAIVIFLFIVSPLLALVIDKWLLPAVQFTGSGFVFLKTAASSDNFYNQIYVLGDDGAGFCSSLYGALKAIIYLIFPNIQAGSLPIQHLFSFYLPVAAFFAGIIALYVILIEKERWRKVTLVTLSLILFPYVTGDYRLIILFIPLWMFMNSKRISKHDITFAILFGLLLIPKDYYIIRDSISISVILNPLLIIIFMILLVHEGLETWKEQNSRISILYPFGIRPKNKRVKTG